MPSDSPASRVTVPHESLAIKSWRYRRKMLEVIKRAGAGHTGGGLSSLDILNVLYNRVLRVSPGCMTDPERDRYIQSKGHCVEALYVVLADKGFFPESDLYTLCQYKSHFVGHPTRKVPGVEQNTGALGHGLSMAVGCALAGKLDNAAYRVFVLLGDGELAEGSNWEAAMLAAHYRLNNLVAIVDRNQLQITGRIKDVCSSEPLAAKFESFGWKIETVNGHDVENLSATLESASSGDKPCVVLADTTKGRGVSFMEDVVKWHHGVPNDEEYERALREIDAAIKSMEAQVST